MRPSVEDIEKLMEAYSVEDILDYAGVSHVAAVYILFESGCLDDFPEELFPV